MFSSDISRRDLIRRLGFAAAALPFASLATSCKKSNDSTATKLEMFGVGTLDIGPNWHKTIDDIGVRLLFKDNQNDVGQVITQMITLDAAASYDVGGLLGGAEAELAQAKTIIPWDLNKVPNFAALWPWVKDIPSARWEGLQYGIPIAVNADAMIYLPEKVGTVDSYHAVFDRKFKGRTSMEDSWLNSVIFTAIYLKESAQANIIDPSDLTLDELHVVMEFLTREKRDGQFLKFWSGWEEGVYLITNGDVWVMTGWEPIVYAAQKKGANALYAKPKEGYEAWSTNLLLHKGAQDHHTLDAAHAFANWCLGGFYGCHLALERGYVVPNDLTLEYAREHMNILNGTPIANIQHTIDNVRTKFSGKQGNPYWLNVRPKLYREYQDLWSKLRAS
jgi:putative spermidine/putrescine transport system substrate-binding protein